MDVPILPISGPDFCGTNMTSEKRKAVRDYLGLARELRDQRDEKGNCSPEAVCSAVSRRGLSFDHISWAFMLYCGPDMFRKIHAEAGSDANYTALRGAVGGSFFEGNLHFDAFTAGDSMDGTTPLMGGPVNTNLTGLFG